MKKKQNEYEKKKSVVVDVEHKYDEEFGEEANYDDAYKNIDSIQNNEEY